MKIKSLFSLVLAAIFVTSPILAEAKMAPTPKTQMVKAKKKAQVKAQAKAPVMKKNAKKNSR